MAPTLTAPSALACPGWCRSPHRSDDGMVRRHMADPEVIDVFQDQLPLAVRVERDDYQLGEPLPTPAVVRVGQDVITPAAARRMAAALLAAAALAEDL